MLCATFQLQIHFLFTCGIVELTLLAVISHASVVVLTRVQGLDIPNIRIVICHGLATMAKLMPAEAGETICLLAVRCKRSLTQTPVQG
jgi:hypothetical protein